MEPFIHSHELAFDIDGVVADTMETFVRLARERYGLSRLSKEDLTCFDLTRCLGLNGEIINDLICTTLDDEHTLELPPVAGAPHVLSSIARHGPLRFVTARIWPESIVQWLHRILPQVPQDMIEVTATGHPDAKLEVLRQYKVRYFVEDRLETCEMLAREGFQPIVFDQPWNRTDESGAFLRVKSWREIHRWILPFVGNTV
jgi:uncharacterized HAD superfamily protein